MKPSEIISLYEDALCQEIENCAYDNKPSYDDAKGGMWIEELTTINGNDFGHIFDISLTNHYGLWRVTKATAIEVDELKGTEIEIDITDAYSEWAEQYLNQYGENEYVDYDHDVDDRVDAILMARI